MLKHWGPILDHPPVTQSHSVPDPVLGRGEKTVTTAPALRVFTTVRYGDFCTPQGPDRQLVPSPAGAPPDSSVASPHPSIVVHTSPPQGSPPQSPPGVSPSVSVLPLLSHYLTLKCLLDLGSWLQIVRFMRAGTLSLTHPSSKTVAYSRYLYLMLNIE